jgi:hypothetical protein
MPFIHLVTLSWEWFWRGEAVRAARAHDTVGEVRRIAQQRAAISAELAGLALDPPGPWQAGSAYHLAASLFVESIGWSLRALSLAPGDAAPRAVPDAPPTSAELERLFAMHLSLLLAIAPGHVAVEHLRHCALEREFESSTRSSREVEADARTLAGVASRLLLSASTPHDPLDRLMLQRVLRLGGLGVLLLAFAVGVPTFRDWRDRHNDISVGKPWLASSSYESVCQSPEHRCDADKSYFFHTQDEPNPWLEIDLLRSERFSRVQVFNREDCCAERAVPLVVEVSNDHENWQEVARRDQAFDVWKASVGSVSARWVRFRVAGRSFMHLDDVQVLR